MARPFARRSLRAATLVDVGREAGVSAMAVSAVLNGARTSSRIAAATQERIRTAAARLQYRPNAAARALAARRMNTLGVAAVVEGGELNLYFLGVLTGILGAAARAGQNTTVFSLHDWQADAARLPGWCDGRIDGMILVAPRLEAAAIRALPRHTPFAALHPNLSLPGAVNLESDEESGAFQLVSGLIARGHRRILHLTGGRGLVGPARRLRGYRQALAAAGISVRADWMVESGLSTREGRQSLRGWLRKSAGRPLPDAIFCANDACAIGALEALAEIGLRVPDDIALAGFDDTLAARTTVPQLTTVCQPLAEMGARAVDALLGRLERPTPAQRSSGTERLVFPTEPVWRASVGGPLASPRLVPGIPRRAG
jgi:LacI family transcriptional regulator